MPVKKFLADLKVDMQERLAKLLHDAVIENEPSAADIIAREINRLRALLEHSTTVPQGPNDDYGDYTEANGKWIDGDSRFYFFQDCVYGIRGEYTEEEDKLLMQEAFDAERQKFERLKGKFARGNSGDATTSRQQISEDVRIAVWRRDGGACARCQTRERLEYDHIVPVSRGGSNTVRNVELLCEACNRSKSNHIQ